MMKQRCAPFVLVALLAPLVGAPVSAADDPATARPEASAAPDPTALAAGMSLTLGPPKDRSIGGWREIGRVSLDWSPRPRHLSVLGERLVAHARTRGTKSARSRDVGWHSVDGLTWTEATIPGDDPNVTDMTVTPDGSMGIMVGYHSEWSEGGSQGAVWTTRDGIDWTQAQAPPAHEVEWVAASDEVVVVSAGPRLWTTTDLEEWTRIKGPGRAGIAYGPGGFLASEGGGQDLIIGTALWHSADGLEWQKVKLPKALRNASIGIDVFPLDDEWLLVPDAWGLRKTIFTSSDGRDWRRAPRPRGMTAGYVSWVDDLGDEVQAFGCCASGPRRSSGAMWTWRPGQKAGKPVPSRHDHIGQPVVWGGKRIALGEPRRPWGVRLWRWEPTAEAP